MKNYVVAGNSLEDVKNGVKALEDAVRRGHTFGVGASTLAELDEAHEARARLLGTATTPTCPCHALCRVERDEEYPEQDLLTELQEYVEENECVSTTMMAGVMETLRENLDHYEAICQLVGGEDMLCEELGYVLEQVVAWAVPDVVGQFLENRD